MLFCACSPTPHNKIAKYYSYETECMGAETDGTQILKAWGDGKNNKQAIEEAEKKAVFDILFANINKGKQDCEKSPIVGEVNARQKYAAFFDKFFAEQGEYKNFVSRTSKAPELVSRDKNLVTNGVEVRVKRTELKQKMLQAGIIKN